VPFLPTVQMPPKLQVPPLTERSRDFLGGERQGCRGDRQWILQLPVRNLSRLRGYLSYVSLSLPEDACIIPPLEFRVGL